LSAFRCVSSGSLMLVFSSLTCPDHAGTFPQRSRPRLLTDAACGGLGSPPARRAQRANLHHWHSTLHGSDLLHRHHSAFRTHASRSSSHANDLRRITMTVPSTIDAGGGLSKQL